MPNAAGPARTRESSAAQAAREEQHRNTARMLLKVMLLVPGPGTVALYGVHVWFRPVWQFELLTATAALMFGAFFVGAALVSRDRFEAAAIVLFTAITAECVLPLLLRSDSFAVCALGEVGAVMVVWFLAPRLLLPAGTLGVAALVAGRVAIALVAFPQAEPPPLAVVLFDAGMAASILPAVVVALHLGQKLNEVPFRHLESAASGRLRVLAAMREMQPELATLATQVSRSADVVASGAQQQAATADQVARATAQLERLLVETSTAATQARTTAELIRKNAAQSRDQLDAVETELNAFLPALRGIAGSVQGLADRSQGTDRVIDAVDDVHAAVKVLALNASIEAARAGEAGRGIAVVASEMRAMIGGTEASVREGRELLAAVRNEAATTMGRAEATAAQLERHLEDLRRARDLIADVMQSFAEAAQSIETIAVAGQDQRRQVEAVAAAMQGLHGNADALTRSAAELLAGTERFVHTQGDVARLVDDGSGAPLDSGALPANGQMDARRTPA